MKYVIGIDLGTSNCAVAYVEPSGKNATVHDFAVKQFVRPGESQDLKLFPSVVYQSFEGEFPKDSLSLPQRGEGRSEGPILGEFARYQAGRVAGRAITSAKSWLIHNGVDRQAPILPWGAAAEVPHLSPVQAQAHLLRHIHDAWNDAHPEAKFADQEVVLTIPASFDEAARALTLQSARDAGFELGKLTLLEEPQAAFYDFTSRNRDSLSKALNGIGLVLVVDVGGGTTDFSLVKVAMLPEGPALERLAVGDHLLLGGDNMDAALARLLESKLFPDGTKRFSGSQWSQALQLARVAKETLLSSNAPASHKITIAGGGSKLIGGGTLSAELTRDEVSEVVAKGFFPAVTPESVPAAPKRGGAVVELGLPFASDAAITRHVVAFLKAHGGGGFPRPDAILLNGGVFNSPVLTTALIDSVSALWPSAKKIPILPHDSLDLAVARGAAYSGLARRALGKKIGGGTPRAFYARLASGDAVCLVPRGLQESETVTLDQTFQLTLGKPVQFQLFSTTADRLDKAGDVIKVEDSLKPLPPIHTILAGDAKKTVAVNLVATLTEVGTIALSLVAGDQRWRLEFELRGSSKSNELTITESMPARFSEATLEVERVFGTRPLPVEPKDVKNLFRTLEKILGTREQWRVPVLRELWTPLFAGVSKRRRSPDHEKVMFQLLGYSLRPGFGYPLDAWRVEQTFNATFPSLLTNHGEQPIWIEFWVLWRRIASGLSEQAQSAIWKILEPTLVRKVPIGLADAPTEKLKGVQPQGLDEMVRCAASLELLPVTEKTKLGEWIVSRVGAPDTVGGPWAWALGRLGARVPIHGAAHRVLSADLAEKWCDVLLKLDPTKHDGALFALTLLCRRTGDRARDVSDETRAKVLTALSKSPESWRQLVAEVVQLSIADEARALGDALPVGLTL